MVWVVKRVCMWCTEGWWLVASGSLLWLLCGGVSALLRGMSVDGVVVSGRLLRWCLWWRWEERWSNEGVHDR